MGIQGLHAVLKPYLTQVHVSKYRGQRVGCDAYAWLHRGAISCAAELAAGSRPWAERGFPAPYVEFSLKMVSLLRRSGATPVLVFDGGKLPAKAQTNRERQERKQAALERGRQLMERGLVEEARSLLAQTVDVTAEMAAELIAHLRAQGVEFLVAPYEADAQLAFLASLPPEAGGVAAVITEDSDLLAYGVHVLLFKCDSGGYAQELCLDALFNPPSSLCGAAVTSFAGWDLAMLQGAAVLAGCDFLASVKGVSFKTAHKLIKARRSLERALSWMRVEKRYQLAVTQDYIQAALKAAHNFRHPLVFDAGMEEGGGLVRLTPLPAELVGDTAQAELDLDLDYLGPHLPDEIARGIAYGYLHPRTHQPHPGAPPPPYTVPSIAARQRPSSWMAPATSVHLGARHGLGPRTWVAAGAAGHNPAAEGQRWEGGVVDLTAADLVGVCPAHRPGGFGSPTPGGRGVGGANSMKEHQQHGSGGGVARGAGAASGPPSSHGGAHGVRDAADAQLLSGNPALAAAGNPFARQRGQDQGAAGQPVATQLGGDGRPLGGGRSVAAQGVVAGGSSTASRPGGALPGPAAPCGVPGEAGLADGALDQAGRGAAALQPAIAPALPQVHDAPGHPGQLSAESAGNAGPPGVSQGKLQRQAPAGKGGQVAPLVPITNVAAAALACQQQPKLAEHQCSSEVPQPSAAGTGPGFEQHGHQRTGAAAQEQGAWRTSQQRAAQRDSPEWQTTVQPNKRRPPSLGSAGSSNRSGGEKKKKGVPDASQLRISMFFSAAQR